MASYRDLLDAIARVRAVTGSPDAWKNGLTGADVAVACTPTSPSGAVDAVLAKLTAAHPSVFAPAAATDPSAPPRPEGATADAIRGAESALARQRSDAAHLDLQVLTAIANAHATAAEGLAQLSALRRAVETAVASRTDLDTPAGARELQRFLVGTMRDIRNVVEHGGLDAESKAALAEALMALYAASTPEASGLEPTTRPRPRVTDEALVGDPDRPSPTAFDDAGAPLPDELSTDLVSDPNPLPAMAPSAVPAMAVPPFGAPMPATAPMGAMPLGSPFSGGLPSAPFGATPGLSGSPRPDLSPAGLTATDLLGHDGRGPDEPPGPTDPKTTPEESVSDPGADDADPAADGRPSPAEVEPEPTPVLLPDGQTVIAPTPELASVITAAVAGAPIPTAFSWQGITIPAPGSPVTAPVDPARLVPGDIAVLTDRHALALGNGKVLLDRQIQPLSSVTGPGFIGWQHPPEPDPMSIPPVPPAPDRSAATVPS